MAKIVAHLDRNKFTISRELKRNCVGKHYSPSQAMEQYKARRFACCPKRKLDNPDLFELVKSKFLDE